MNSINFVYLVLLQFYLVRIHSCHSIYQKKNSFSKYADSVLVYPALMFWDFFFFAILIFACFVLHFKFLVTSFFFSLVIRSACSFYIWTKKNFHFFIEITRKKRKSVLLCQLKSKSKWNELMDSIRMIWLHLSSSSSSSIMFLIHSVFFVGWIPETLIRNEMKKKLQKTMMMINVYLWWWYKRYYHQTISTLIIIISMMMMIGRGNAMYIFENQSNKKFEP